MSGFRRVVERISVGAYVHPRLEEAPVANLVRAFIPTLGNIRFARKQSSARLDNADATQQPLRFATVRSGPVSSFASLSNFPTFGRVSSTKTPCKFRSFKSTRARSERCVRGRNRYLANSVLLKKQGLPFIAYLFSSQDTQNQSVRRVARLKKYECTCSPAKLALKSIDFPPIVKTIRPTDTHPYAKTVLNGVVVDRNGLLFVAPRRPTFHRRLSNNLSKSETPFRQPFPPFGYE